MRFSASTRTRESHERIAQCAAPAGLLPGWLSTMIGQSGGVHVSLRPSRYCILNTSMAQATAIWNRTGELLRSDVVQNKWLQAAAIAVVLFTVYWLTSVSANPFN